VLKENNDYKGILSPRVIRLIKAFGGEQNGEN